MMMGSYRRRVIEVCRTKKKVWVQGFSHIMLGLADEPEHGKDLKRKIMEVSTKLGLSLPRRTRRKW